MILISRKKALVPPTCLDLDSLPSKESLKQRLQFMALMEQLDPDISEDVIDFVALALDVRAFCIFNFPQTFLLNVMQEWMDRLGPEDPLPKKRTRKSAQTPVKKLRRADLDLAARIGLSSFSELRGVDVDQE